MAFQAKYGGNCGACPERIRPGQQVTYVDDELVHEECAEAFLAVPRRVAKPDVVCTECFLVKPCECDDRSVA